MLNTYPCNPFPISSEQLHKGDNEDLQAQINAITDGSVIDSFGDVETALDTKADNDIIAPEFDAEAGTYEIGDLVMYQGKLYEFITAHETAGDWDPTEVTEKTVADEIDTVKSGLIDVQNRRHVYNISTADAELNTSYTVDLPSGYNGINTIITGINFYKYSTLYSEMYIAKDNDLDCTVMINSSDKLLYNLRGSTTVGANTYLRVMIERID